ncbi:MAG: BMP family ABC transporter substrate-binding protein, partial [Nocardioidaceae bacterium]|nr:BMP family ABC transporter substrate-binding protein [Nocardioidaceae bacterium]
VFDTKSASYLAGYLAAAKTESGKVGTFGGLPIPTVTDFMDGFMQGIDAYNQDEGKDVKLLGWDGKNGQFTEDFEDTAKGQQIGEQLVQQGADIIFPVAGPAGLGGLQAAQDADVRAIWVDTDGCVSAAEYCDVLLTSVMKAMDTAVTEAIKASVEGKLNNKPYLGTLENNGVGLAPLAGDVDDELAGKINELREGLIDGSIKLK